MTKTTMTCDVCGKLIAPKEHYVPAKMVFSVNALIMVEISIDAHPSCFDGPKLEGHLIAFRDRVLEVKLE